MLRGVVFLWPFLVYKDRADKRQSPLLGLPDGIHSRRFVCTRHLRVQRLYMMMLVEACSHTLEFIDIVFRPFLPLASWDDSINLSVATKLKEVVF